MRGNEFRTLYEIARSGALPIPMRGNEIQRHVAAKSKQEVTDPHEG